MKTSNRSSVHSFLLLTAYVLRAGHCAGYHGLRKGILSACVSTIGSRFKSPEFSQGPGLALLCGSAESIPVPGP